MEPLRPGQRLLPHLLIRDDEKKLARAERLGRVFDSGMITVTVCLGTATNLVASASACRTAGGHLFVAISPLLHQPQSLLRKRHIPERISRGFELDGRRTELAKESPSSDGGRLDV